MSNRAHREHWGSRLGFVWSAIGSAVGLGSIWRFPYVVGENGGGGFLILYLIALLLVGLPVLVCELLIGEKSQLNPAGAFARIGKSSLLRPLGSMTIVTGFLVSIFYAVISAWSLAYLVQALTGQLTHLTHAEASRLHFLNFQNHLFAPTVSLVGFLMLAAWVLQTGVKKGIETCNRFLIPALLLLLIFLACKGLTMDGAAQGLSFLFRVDLNQIGPATMLTALGQAFFSLSLGQGTMITYGSYLHKNSSIPSVAWPIALSSVVVPILAGLAIFPLLFSFGLNPKEGTGLMFETLPLLFSSLPLGYPLSIAFFLALTFAALTSQISALEPLICYLIDKKRYARLPSVLLVTGTVTLLALPLSLTFGPFATWHVLGYPPFEGLILLCLNLLIPLGGLSAICLVAYRTSTGRLLRTLYPHTHLSPKQTLALRYFLVTIKFLAPAIVLLIFAKNLDLF